MLKRNWSMSSNFFSTTLHSLVNTIGRTYVFTYKGINIHALMIAITKQGEV
jgi:hypothetical protein